MKMRLKNSLVGFIMQSSLENRYFKDRKEASEQLLESMDLDKFDYIKPIVIGVSEGGVYVANQLALRLNCMMDILLTEPIKAPNNEDVTIAMISETKEVVMNKSLIDAFDINEDFVYTTAQQMYDEKVVSYVYRYRKGEELLSLDGKDVILVDECIESGLTMMASLKSVIERGAKNVYIATPILDKMVYDKLLTVCDGVFCPHIIEHYISVEYYFDKFDDISYEEIVDMMEFYAKKRYNEIIK